MSDVLDEKSLGQLQKELEDAASDDSRSSDESSLNEPSVIGGRTIDSYEY
jgi:hypothetical protein